jgi:hypothetical protein
MSAEIVHETPVAVPREIDEQVIAAAVRYGEIVSEAGKITIQTAVIHQGQGEYIHV